MRPGDARFPTDPKHAGETRIRNATDETGVSEGQCAVHGRFLVLRELEAGCCGWCVPERFDWSEKDLEAIRAMNTPPVFPTFTCYRSGCAERFEARSGRTLYCSDACRAVDAEEHPCTGS